MIYSNQKNLKIHACCIIDCRITCMVCLILRYKVITSYWRRNSNKASAPIIMAPQKYFLNINQESNSSDMLTSACLPECVEMIEKNLALVLSKPCPCLIQSLMSWLEKLKKKRFMPIATVITTGWPETKQDIQEHCIPCWKTILQW